MDGPEGVLVCPYMSEAIREKEGEDMTVHLFEVGGCVRDEFLGLHTKDIDYTAVAPSYAALRDHLMSQGFEIFVETPEFLTIRARYPRVPKGVRQVFAGRDVTGLTADFVLARKDGSYYDGRHPDSVEPGSLLDDLRRRDFTVNAMAKDANGNLYDPFDGMNDLRRRVLRCVGTPEERFTEDALRALRAVRFAVTKGMALHGSVSDALRSEWLAPLLGRVSVERRREELLRAFKADTMATFELLHFCGPAFMEACFADGLWLMPSLKG